MHGPKGDQTVPRNAGDLHERCHTRRVSAEAPTLSPEGEGAGRSAQAVTKHIEDGYTVPSGRQPRKPWHDNHFFSLNSGEAAPKGATPNPSTLSE